MSARVPRDSTFDIFDAFKLNASTSDVILINTLFDLGRILAGSVDSLTDDGEKRHISTLINGFIGKIDFGRDLEQQLNMYVECRRIFSNLDLVIDKLILSVSNLAVKAFKFVKGKHTKKTSAFVKACFAYCHITIPSINDVMRKLQLLLLLAQVSLLNQCLPHTDTFLKAAISLIPELQPFEEVDGRRVHTEDKLLAYMRSLFSTLIIAPGHPEHGPFYIVNGLLNALPKYQWQKTTGVLCRVYINMLPLLCTYAQRKFPYHIATVESNDELYGGAPGYMRELFETLCLTIEEVIKQLTELGEKEDTVSKLCQSRLIFEFVNVLASEMELNADVSAFVLKLLELANKNKTLFTRVDNRLMVNSIEFLKTKAVDSSVSSTLISSLRAMLPAM